MTDKKGVSTSFERLPNREAEKHFNQKSLITSAEFAHFKAYQHALAFTVAGLADKDMLAEVHKAIKSAIDNGTSFNEFKKSLKPFLVSKGWLAPELTGDDKADKALLKDYERVLNRRLKTIYHTNKQTAYAAGRWERLQRTKERFPFLQYMKTKSAKYPRDEHKAYYGIVRHIDDPIWQSIFPPNGFGCKCWVKPLTTDEAREIGISTDDEVAGLPMPDFDSNFDRLGGLLRLAEDKHGAEFAQKLGEQALQKLTNIHHKVFFKSNSNDNHYFPKDKLDKLLKAFDRQGIPYLIGEEGGRFAKQMGAEAVYYPTEVGMSGFFAFPENPTRTQVIEELLHYGQHKSTNFASLEWQDIVQFEIQAQKKLLIVGQLLGWTVAELEQIERALVQWQQEWDKSK